MAKHISKKKKTVVIDSMDDVVPGCDFDDSGKSQSPLCDDNMGILSPMRGSPLKSNFEEIGSPGGSVKTSNVDTTTN